MKWCTLAGAALVAVAAAARAETPTAKPAVTGSFTINSTTYKVASALAYTIAADDQKRTVVILTERPLNATPLRASLRKNGDGRDFDPFPRLELVFDDKGELRTMHIQTQDAGIKHLPAAAIKDHKAAATVADGRVKGSAATQGNEPREAINGHTYRFNVTFEVPLTRP